MNSRAEDTWNLNITWICVVLLNWTSSQATVIAQESEISNCVFAGTKGDPGPRGPPGEDGQNGQGGPQGPPGMPVSSGSHCGNTLKRRTFANCTVEMRSRTINILKDSGW